MSDTENRCPDCLCMELKVITIQVSEGLLSKILPGKSKVDSDEQINLHLTIQFNEQWEDLPAGRIKFGLRGGELRLTLENGEIPLQDRELGGSLELIIQKERQQQESSENQSGLETSWTDRKIGIKANISEKQFDGKTDKFLFASCQITTKGSKDRPAWVFEAKTGELVLKGLLRSTKLGTLKVTEIPCHLEATFEVTLRDIQITQAEGIWLAEISREKRAVLDIALAKLLLKYKLKPYVSRLEMQYV